MKLSRCKQKWLQRINQNNLVQSEPRPEKAGKKADLKHRASSRFRSKRHHLAACSESGNKHNALPNILARFLRARFRYTLLMRRAIFSVPHHTDFPLAIAQCHSTLSRVLIFSRPGNQWALFQDRH